jgi:alcohol dehydrogenase class IV
MADLLTPIEIIRPQSIEFGAGLVGAVGRWAAAKGIARSLVVADAFNAARDGPLGLPGEVVVFGEVKPEPDIANLEAALALAERARPELVVGFGGGSAMDLASALGLPAAAAERAVLDAAHGFCARLGIEMWLSCLGVPDGDLAAMAEEAHAIRRLLDNNPRDIGREQILAMYQAAF